MKVKLCLSTLESRENPSGSFGDFWAGVSAGLFQGLSGGSAGATVPETTAPPVQTPINAAVYPVDNNPMPDVPPMGPPWWPNGIPPIMLSPTGELEGVVPPVSSPPVPPPASPPADQLAPPSTD